MMKDATHFLKENKIISVYAVLLFLTLIFLALVNYFNISYPLTVTSKQASGELVVVGEGKMDIVPDSATIQAGITVNNAKTVQEAQMQMNSINDTIVTNVVNLKVDKKDIKTSNYSINPNYNYEKGNTISGYNGNASVTITIRDISKLSGALEEITKAGANQISTNYTVDKPEKYREQVRDKAIANAKEQAQKLANSLGIHLGKATNIVESTGGVPIPMMYGKDAVGIGGAGETSVNLQPGSQTITSTVTVYFDKR